MSIVSKAALKLKFETGDFPTQQDFTDFVDTVYPYEKYVALLSQTGTDAPIPTVLENTLSGTLVWSYQAVGEYRVTLTGAFLIGKVVIFHKDLSGGYRIVIQRLTDNVIQVITYDPTTPFAGSNGRLSNTSIEIRVYP